MKGLTQDNVQKLLIIDDFFDNYQCLTQYLSCSDYDLIHAQNIEEVRTCIETEPDSPPNLILMAVNHPGINVHEQLQNLHSVPQLSDVPILVSITHKTINELNSLLECGANDYLIAPFTQAELLTRIQTQLNLHKLNRENLRLKQENTDLKILLETSTEHGDLVLDQLHDQAEEVVRESEHRLAQFLEAVPVGVLVV